VGQIQQYHTVQLTCYTSNTFVMSGVSVLIKNLKMSSKEDRILIKGLVQKRVWC